MPWLVPRHYLHAWLSMRLEPPNGPPLAVLKNLAPALAETVLERWVHYWRIWFG
jgi:hypothetical protein